MSRREFCVERTNCGIGSRWFWNWPSSGEQIKSRRTGKHKRQSWSNTFCWIQDYLIFKRPFWNWPCSSDSEHKFDHPPPSPWWSVKIRCTDLDFRDRETGFAFWCICTSHMVFFLLFSFSYFLRLNRLLFAGVCLVGASRAPRASLTRAQQRLNNYSTEYNLSPISSNRCHIYARKFAYIGGSRMLNHGGWGEGGGWVNILSTTADNTFNPPLSSPSVPRYWLSASQKPSKQIFSPESIAKLYFFVKLVFD